MSKNKIIIYSDCNQWGGHELMTAEMANSLARDYDVIFCYFNDKFESAIGKNIRKIKIPIRSRLSYCGLGSFDVMDIRYLVGLFKEIAPSFIIVSQGVIEIGLKALWAAKIAKIRAVSYIPLCFPFSLMNSPFAGIRDLFGQMYFRLFDAFITISNEQRYYLNRTIKNKKIYVLENPISESMGRFRPLPKKPPEKPKVGIVGRISFSHKGQDQAIEVAQNTRKNGKDITFLIIGDGEDKAKLVKMIKDNGLEKSFIIKKWEENKKRIYSGLDCVLITSHFEGVPLVLLESIAFNKLIFAPCEGVYPRYLPKEFLYSDLENLSDKLVNFNHYWELWGSQGKGIRCAMLKKNEKNRFHKCLLKIVNKLND